MLASDIYSEGNEKAYFQNTYRINGGYRALLANIGLEYTWNNEYCDACSELMNESALLITTNSPEY